MGRSKQNREKTLEKKRIAERERKAKLKSNPELHKKLKENDLNRYYRKKEEGKILPLDQLPSDIRKCVRERNKINVKRYRERKRNIAATNEDMIEIVDDSKGTELPDPLSELPSPGQQRPSVKVESPSNLVFKSPEIGTRRHSLRASSLHSSLKLREVSPTQTSQDLKAEVDFHVDIIDNDPSQQKLESLPSRPTTLHSQQISTTPGVHLSRPRGKKANRLYRHSSASTSSAMSNPCSSLPAKSISTPEQNTKVEGSKAEANSLSARKFKGKMSNDVNVLHKRIETLTRLNNKYRKQLYRLKKSISSSQNPKPGSDPEASNDSAVTKKKKLTNLRTHIKQLEETIQKFYLDHDNN